MRGRGGRLALQDTVSAASNRLAAQFGKLQPRPSAETAKVSQMPQAIGRFAAMTSLLLPLAFGVDGHGAASPSSQVFAPGSRGETWRLLAKLARNASRCDRWTEPGRAAWRLAPVDGMTTDMTCLDLQSERMAVTAEELASEWPLDAVLAIPLFGNLTREAKRDLLTGIAELQLLGDAPMHGLDRVREFLGASAASEGDPAAQFWLGAFADQGREDDSASENRDPAAGVLFYEFASRGGSLPATMALGYRYLHGYNVPASCDTAMAYYRHAAARVIAEEASLLPSQMFALPKAVRLSDNHAQDDRRAHPARDQEDLNRAEYLRHRARAERTPELLEHSASLVLFSDLYCSPKVSWLLGDDRAARDACADRSQEAVAFLHEAAASGSYSARALLGHVYAFSLGGEPRNVTRAVGLYHEALEMALAAGVVAAEAANGLGLVHSNGLGGDGAAEPKEAMEFFKMAADAGLADGVYNMAVMMSDAYPEHAQEYWVAAAEVGHLHSMFELARVKDREHSAALGAAGVAAVCGEAVSLYKQVAERSAELTRVLDLALAQFNAGAWDRARLLYRVAAEAGSEVAQSNVAWMMERALAWPMSRSGGQGVSREYLRLVRRAADQDSPDAFVRLGDWEFERGDHAAALAYYSEADALSHGTSGRALFSIGYMHEHGLGVTAQSFERASLYYLLAGDAERVMWYPMALLRLRLEAQAAMARVLSLVTASWSAAMEWWGRTAEPVETEKRREDSSEGGLSPSASAVAAATSASEKDAHAQVAELTGDPSPLSTSWVEFAAALQFVGRDSQLDVELDAPVLGVDFQDFTIESWIFIDAVPDPATTREDGSQTRRPMVVVDALDNFQVELVPDSHDEHSWQLRFRKFSLVRADHPEASVLFASARLTSEQWLHLALTFDARTQTVTLFVGGKSHGHYSLQPRRFSELTDDLVSVDRSAASRLVAVGSSLSRHVNADNNHAFCGQLARLRVWRARMKPEQILQLMNSSDREVKPGVPAAVAQQLVIDLRVHVFGSEDGRDEPTGDIHVLNGDRLVPSARGLRLRMVPFPPSTVGR